MVINLDTHFYNRNYCNKIAENLYCHYITWTVIIIGIVIIIEIVIIIGIV